MVLLVENPAHQCLFAGNDLYRLLITDGFHDFFTTLLHLTQRDIISFNRLHGQTADFLLGFASGNFTYGLNS